MDLENVVHISVGYYLATKKNEILPFVATWMYLEGIMPSESRERKLQHNTTYRWNLKNIKRLVNITKKR